MRPSLLPVAIISQTPHCSAVENSITSRCLGPFFFISVIRESASIEENQLLSALALSVGLSPAWRPRQSALPSQVPDKKPFPALRRCLKSPACGSQRSGGRTARQSQRIPEELKKYFGEDAPDQQAQPFEGLGSGVIIDAAKGYIPDQ